MNSKIHFVGAGISIGSKYRQRCSWCGVIIEDGDYNNIATPDGQPFNPFWTVGKLIEITDGNPRGSWIRNEEDFTTIPNNCCVTREEVPRKTLQLVEP